MLTSLKVKNFRSCADVEVRFDRPLTALIGRNGAGKTNLVRSLEWVASNAISQQMDESPLDRVQGTELDAVVTAQFGLTTYSYRLRFVVPSVISQPKTNVRLAESLQQCSSDGKWESLLEREHEQIILEARTEPINVGANVPMLSALASLLPERDVLTPVVREISQFFGAVSYYVLDEPEESQNWFFERDYQKWVQRYVADGTPTDHVPYRLLYMKREQPALYDEFLSLVGPQGLGLVERLFVHSTPVATGPTTPTDQKADENQFHIFLFTPGAGLGGSGRPLAFSDLSAGTRRVIQVIVSLVFDRRSVMLIEQPEDSIHPGLLRKLIDLVRSYSHRTQIIFTTHSPDVLNLLEPEELRLVSAPKGQTTVSALSTEQIRQARNFLSDTGPLADFVETLMSEVDQPENSEAASPAEGQGT